MDPARFDTVAEGETVHDRVGTGFFVDLVDRFYEGVEAEPVLRSLYPEDLTESKRDLAEFLTQYWGGPTTYSERKGHPRLRMRHAPFVIGADEVRAWMRAMTAAVDAADCDDEVRAALHDYFSRAAPMMMNAAPPSPPGSIPVREGP